MFAALLAAIISSLASMVNSISTLFTLDIHPSLNMRHIKDDPVMTGRVVALVAMLVAMLTARPLLGSFDQAFQYIQEFTGFFTPGICVLFFMGVFWKKTTANGALAAAIGSAVLSFAFKMLMPELPFIDRVGIVFISCIALAAVISLLENRDQVGAVDLQDIDFKTTTGFNTVSAAVIVLVGALYATWW